MDTHKEPPAPKPAPFPQIPAGRRGVIYRAENQTTERNIAGGARPWDVLPVRVDVTEGVVLYMTSAELLAGLDPGLGAFSVRPLPGVWLLYADGQACPLRVERTRGSYRLLVGADHEVVGTYPVGAVPTDRA